MKDLKDWEFSAPFFAFARQISPEEKSSESVVPFYLHFLGWVSFFVLCQKLSKWKNWIRHLPSTWHSVYLSYYWIWIFCCPEKFGWDDIKELQIVSLCYLQSSILVEANQLNPIQLRHHIATSVFLMLPFYHAAFSPTFSFSHWLLWLNHLGLGLELTTPLLNAFEISGLANKIRNFRKQEKEKEKGNEKEKEKEKVLGFTEWEKCCVSDFLKLFFVIRCLFPTYLLVNAIYVIWANWCDKRTKEDPDEEKQIIFNYTVFYCVSWIVFICLQTMFFQRLYKMYKQVQMAPLLSQQRECLTTMGNGQCSASNSVQGSR